MSFIGVFIIGVIIGRFVLAPHPPLADDNRPVYPTIYITGSDGKGKDTSHAEMPHNEQAINYIKCSFISKKNTLKI